MKKVITLLICLLAMSFMYGCSGETASETVAEDVPSVTVFTDGHSEYSVVIAARASDTVYNFAELFNDLSGISLNQKNDRWEETHLEILLGATQRTFSVSLLEEINSLDKEYGIHYVIAEKDGRIAILASDDIGYQYAEDRIRSNYYKNGTMKIPVDCLDLQSVTWDEYYKSEYYAAVLKKEEERIQREKAKEEENMLKKQQELEKSRQMISAFKSEDFGLRTKFPTKLYAEPAFYPAKSHPRILFTENSIGTVRANLNAPENKAAYDRYIKDSEQYTFGILLPNKDQTTHNMDYNVMAIIEAKAFRYAMTGEELYGYQAIYSIKNVLLTLDIPKGTLGDDCRAYGYVMYIAGCVYDWCYDLLTDECKQQLINGCVTLMGAHMEMGVPPTKQGAVYGHGTEAQLLRDWLTFAIACYDEAPDIYELVAGRIFAEYAHTNNYFFASGNHWEGSDYGPYRFHFTLYTQLLLDRMTDGKCALFSDDMHQVATTLLHYIRPDSQALRIGDVWTEASTRYSLTHYGNVMFYAANYYKDPVLKGFAKEKLNDFSTFTLSNNALTPVMLLTLNDPGVACTDYRTLPLTRLTKTPLESVFARSSWSDKNAVMVYMNMNKAYGGGHGHMDCGSFQIFYKGILASDSGKYSSWGDAHHKGYTMQTVSTNSLLIYNPNLADTKTGNYVYSGGQSITAARVSIPETLEKILTLPGQNQCKVFGAANAEKDGKYLYSFLAGDMTAAYDAETVEEVTRYMLSVMTDSPDYPLVLATFDRITSDDAAYKKSALIHVQEKPVITEDGFAIVTNTRNGNSGKMVVQSVMSDTEFTVIGGDGKKYWLHDKNAETNDAAAAGSLEEYGWGRIEISPAKDAKTDHLLTLYYVTDATNEAAPIKAVDISTDILAGTQILGQALLFPKNKQVIEKSVTFTLSGDTSVQCYMAGIAAGKWTVTDASGTRTAEVVEGESILAFTASAGIVTVSPAE